MLLQVGYGLVHDLWAIAAALGDEGLGCVSVVEPQLDVGTLHRQLHKAHVVGINQVPAMPSHNFNYACIQLGTQGMHSKDQWNVGCGHFTCMKTAWEGCGSLHAADMAVWKSVCGCCAYPNQLVSV